MDRDTKKSVRLLMIHIAVLAAAAGASVLIGNSDITFWKCGIHELTGLYCLTCGATRAAAALGRFDIMASIFYNPLPFLLACFLLVVIVFEIICIIRKKRVKVEWLPWSVLIILGIEVAFCLLRNFRVIPGI